MPSRLCMSFAGVEFVREECMLGSRSQIASTCDGWQIFRPGDLMHTWKAFDSLFDDFLTSGA